MAVFERSVPNSFSGARLRLPTGFFSALNRAAAALRSIPGEDQPPAGIMIGEHARALQEEAEALRERLKKEPRLPAREGEARVLLFARELLREERDGLTPGLILQKARAFWRDTEPEHRELCHLRDALAIAALETLMPVLASCVRDARLHREAAALSRGLRQRSTALPIPDALLLEKAHALLIEAGDQEALKALEALAGCGGQEMLLRAQAERTRQEETARDCLRVLRQLQSLPFSALIERLSPPAQILRQEKTYRRMDAESRNFYVLRVLLIAQRLRVSASAVARAALTLAQGHSGPEGESGYYLIERPDLIAKYLLKSGSAARPRRHPERLPWLLAVLSALLWTAMPLLAGAPFYSLPLTALCGGEVTRLLMRPLLRRRFPARMLPRLSPACLPQGQRVLIAVPALLLDAKQTLRLCRHLSVLRQNAPKADVLLLGDLPDSDRAECPGDAEIAETALAAVDALNRAWGGGFYFLLRERVWDAGERRFTGRERKRGALEALNRLLIGQEIPAEFAVSSCALEGLQGRYAYVLTLDADTFLPAGALDKMVGTMEHPLQKGRLSVIQPVMETAPDRAVTRTQRWLGGQGGDDAYHLSRQEVYQDVFGRGSFVGKGFYEPRRWMEKTEGRIPDGRVLSHDLLEGELAGCALADDILLFDGHPAKLSGWQKRLHRWTRGDWQLLPFLFSRKLDGMARYKMYDNLRRSLLPAAQTLLLLLGAALGKPPLLLLALPWPMRGLPKRLLLLPAKAYTLLDAAFRALHRQFISHRHLLQWVTAEQAEGGGSGLPLPCIAAQLAGGGLLAALSLLPGGFLPAVWAGVWWAVAPLLIPYLDGRDSPERPLTHQQIENIRHLARDTWRFFEETVTESTLYLPPDNVQEEPEKGPALRTSPTNIGLYLLSCAAAKKLRFITAPEMAKRMDDTLSAVEKLPLWHGHLYNWYGLTDGSPLPPRFVSTVDSGNLAACLLACAQVCRNLLSEIPEPLRALPARMDALARHMDFARLYDKKTGLFSIGFDAVRNRLSASHYDRMASEMMLTSFTAIRLRQIPRGHWRRLDRSRVRAGGGPTLLSWGGTAFEYLLPTLLLPLIPGTLTGESGRNAVRAQMAAAGSRPFGISECGYYAFDPELNYQYRAFGLPALAVSTETAGSVTAPYASMLALPFFPSAVAANLERMQKLGWADGHGLFEAVDHTPGRFNAGPRIIKSHMAHHQGMILCAVCNALTDLSLVRAFMAPPEAEACADLLWERSTPLHRKRAALPAPRKSGKEPVYPAHTARKDFPLDAQALYGHGMTWVITGQGNGYLMKNGVMLTRFREECFLPSGPQLYLRDERTGAYKNLFTSSEMTFAPGCVLCEGTLGKVKYSLRCFVAPLTGWAVQGLTLENAGRDAIEMTAVSFLEVALSDQKADSAHPNYRDLSVRVKEWGGFGLCAERLPGSPEEKTPFLHHAVSGAVTALRRQGDRRLFLGRSGSYARPGQLSFPFGDAPCRLGDVLAPCLSLMARVNVRGKTELCFVTFADEAETEYPGAALPPDQAAARAALAVTQYQMTLRSLRIGPELLPLCHAVMGAMLFTRQPHQRHTPVSSKEALWKCGVSGDLPVLLADLRELDRMLIRTVLKAHAFLRMQGIWTDVIFLCPPEHEYRRPLRDALNRQAALSPFGDLMGQTGGLHIATDEGRQREALIGAARLTLRSGIPVSGQLASMWTSETPLPSPAAPEPTSPPPLQCGSGFGGFAEDGTYFVTAPAPVPWHHLLSGQRFGTLVSEQGILQSFGENSRLDVLTLPAPDVHRDWESEEILLRTEDGRDYPLARCTAVFSPGMAEYRTKCGLISSELKVFSDPARPFGIRQITLRGKVPQRLTLLYRPRFALGEAPEYTRIEPQPPFLFARSGQRREAAFAAIAGGETECAENDTLCCHAVLRPRDICTFTVVLGIAKDAAEARQTLDEIQSVGVGTLERELRGFWQERLSGLRVFGGTEAEEFLFNGFVPYQVWASRLMSRMGPYQPGGAYGFRDQLQDLLALLHTAPAAARAHLLRCAAHQFPEGDVQHWWHEPRTGVRTRISDDKLFLPFMTAQYVAVTGDADVLEVSVPYLSSPTLGENERERYETPETAALSEPLRSHCLRAINSVAMGRHGLPLMGSGDWNDGLDRVGGKSGESVWLGFFLALVLKQFATLCDAETADEMAKARRQLLNDLEGAWTGKWYLRAWRDSGEPLGGPETVPPRIDLIVSCFAVLAGAPRDHAREALRHAVKRLYDRERGIVKLVDTPYTPQEDAGYIGAYLPGVRENGGQYTHAVPWLVMALCELEENDAAWEIMDAALPVHHADTPEKTRVYQLEPYVFCGDVSAGQNVGRGGWSWYTGSAAWMYYVYFTCLLGFEKRGNKARLRLHARHGQEEYTVAYRFGRSLYHFTASPDVFFPTLDGERLPDGWAALRDDGRTHDARFPLHY